MRMFIDPPSPFAPLMDWKRFLADLARLKSDDADLRKAIADAQRVIAEKDVTFKSPRAPSGGAPR